MKDAVSKSDYKLVISLSLSTATRIQHGSQTVPQSEPFTKRLDTGIA